MNTKLANILYFVLIIAVVTMCVYVIVWLNGHGFQCMRDPIAYAQQVSNKTCMCMENSLKVFGTGVNWQS